MLAVSFILYALLLPFAVPIVLGQYRDSRVMVFLLAVGLFGASVLFVRLIIPGATARRIRENLARSCAVRLFCLGGFSLTLGLILLTLLHYRHMPGIYFWLFTLPALVVFGLNAIGIDLPRRSPRPSPEPDEPPFPEEPDEPDLPEIQGDLILITYRWKTLDGQQYSIRDFPIRRKVYEWTKRQRRVPEWEKWPYEYVADAISGTSRQPAEIELRDLARRLYAMGKTFGSFEEVSFVLQFIQSAIKYEHDPGHDNPFVGDYPKYPVETLGDTAGDCEDVALLGAAMLVSMGYRAALLLLPGHAALGVPADDMPGRYFEKDGIRYYYCEMTGSGWSIGEVPKDMAGHKAQVLPIPRPGPRVVRPDSTE